MQSWLIKDGTKSSKTYVINCNNIEKGCFYILNNISAHVTLVYFMDSLGNMNHILSVVGGMIFDYSYKKYLPLIIELLNLIFSSSDKDKFVTLFECFNYSMGYFNIKADENCVQK